MKKNYIKKERSLEDLIGRKTELPGEQVSSVPKSPEATTEEAISQTEKAEIKIQEIEKADKAGQQKEKISIHGKAGLSAQQPPDDVKYEIKQIESILQEGLEETYKTMDPVSREQFKTQGEDTARAINILLSKTKVKVKEIVNLIVKWLKLIPGINKFFIEQEAKIKADKLLAQKRKKDEEKI
ncbi:MAG: hypothetical protein V1688_00300 [bacterium]